MEKQKINTLAPEQNYSNTYDQITAFGYTINLTYRGYPGGPVVKNLPANAGDTRD